MATKYLTVGHNSSPYITTYSQSGSTFTKLSNPSTLPVDNVYAVHWNYNATSLAVATFASSPYVIVYNVAADVFTKIAEFTELSGSLALAWSPDGSKLVLGDIASPYIRIYNRSGDTFTQTSDPGTLPTGAAQGISWSPDGNKLAVAHSTSPFITVYQVSGDTFTKVTNPGTLPHGQGLAVAWNPTSDVLAVGGEGTSSIYPGRIYNYSSNTLSYVTTIGSPGAGVADLMVTNWPPCSTRVLLYITKVEILIHLQEPISQ
jgi:WD40 repeat protein